MTGVETTAVPERVRRLTDGLPLQRPGIEISPLFRPTVHRGEANVFTVDVCSAEESRRKHAETATGPIVDVDVVWTPGQRLMACVPDGSRFSWAIASHVLEHVPDPVGWLLQVFEVLEDGAVLSLALPDKRHCFDRFRADTTVAELVDAWVRAEAIPSPRQLFDFLDVSAHPDGARCYSDADALHFLAHSWTTGQYVDAHCSVFSPETVRSVFERLVALGVLAVEVSEVVDGGNEFFVRLTRTGEPTVRHPGPPNPLAAGGWTPDAVELLHLRRAYAEAVEAQERLKAEIRALSAAPPRRPWLPVRIVRGLRRPW